MLLSHIESSPVGILFLSRSCGTQPAPMGKKSWNTSNRTAHAQMPTVKLRRYGKLNAHHCIPIHQRWKQILTGFQHETVSAVCAIMFVTMKGMPISDI